MNRTFHSEKLPINNASRRLSLSVLILLAALNIYEFLFGIMTPALYGCSAHTVLELGEWYRIITYMFIHANLQHIMMNTFALIAVGQDLSKKRGTLFIILLYITGGIAASLTSIGWSLCIAGDVETFSVGASGAIYALLGGVFADQMIKIKHSIDGKDKGIKIRETIYLLTGAVLLLSARSDANVDMAAHAGGFLWGALLTYL